ncbi:MAG: hypothetical protein KME46_19035 [Brasilonema angustatum HA4187-MV1]|jgi:hypothetical protein|nr:hypothetical protein [Brasilonema angustatum HA4187-MV1]
MLERYTIRHQAFLQAFNKLDLSTLSPELQEELHQVRQALGNNVNEATIRRLDALVKKSDRLNQLYESERLSLIGKDSQQERDKGFPVKDDNPKPEDLGVNNVNPSSTTANTHNSTHSSHAQTQRKSKKN